MPAKLMTLIVATFASLCVAEVENRYCSEARDCRVFGDVQAVCLDAHCVCSNSITSNDTDICTRDATDITPVSYVLSFVFPCDAFFGDASLPDRLTASASSAVSAYDISLVTIFSCGSTNMIASGDVPAGLIGLLASEMGGAVETAVVGTAMEGSLREVAVQVEEGASMGCVVGAPVAGAVLAGGVCVATACEAGFVLQNPPPSYKAQCVKGEDVDRILTKLEKRDDTDLSNGAICAIVLGTVGLICVAAILAWLLFRKVEQPEPRTEQKPIPDDYSDDCPVDVLV